LRPLLSEFAITNKRGGIIFRSDMVRVNVEDEFFFRKFFVREAGSINSLASTSKNLPEYRIHREECRRHSAGRGEKLTASYA
jgi:hypothetical protein